MLPYSSYEHLILLALSIRTILYPLYILAHIKKSIDCEYKLISRILNSVSLVHVFALLIQTVYHLDYYNFVAHFHVLWNFQLSTFCLMSPLIILRFCSSEFSDFFPIYVKYFDRNCTKSVDNCFISDGILLCNLDLSQIHNEHLAQSPSAECPCLSQGVCLIQCFWLYSHFKHFVRI